MRARRLRAPAFVGRIGRGARCVPALVWAGTGAFAGLMLAMTLLYPVNYGIDEAAHFDMAYSYSQGHVPYAPGTRFIGQGIIGEQTYAFLGNPPRDGFAGRAVPPRSSRGSIDSYGGDTPTDVPDQMTQHPPLYYLLGAAILDIPGVSHQRYDIQFTLLRFLSLLLLLPLPWLYFKTALRIGGGNLAPLASLVPLAVPALARVGASVTNDSLLILSFSAAVYFVSRVITGDATRRTALWLSVWVLVALLTKGFALQLPLVVLIAYLVCRRYFRVPVREPLLIAAVGSALGALWWIHNLVAYGRVQPNGYPAHFNEAVYQSISAGPGTIRNYIPEFGRELVSRFWGSLGLLEPPHPNDTFGLIATLVILFLVADALFLGFPRPASGGRIRAAVWACPWCSR